MFVRSGTQTPFSTTGVHALPIAEFSLYFQHVLPVWVAVAPLLAVWSVGVRQLLKQRRQRIVQLVAGSNLFSIMSAFAFLCSLIFSFLVF
jgi:hypothetical protein